MKFKEKNHQDRWQPMADIFSALALIFILLLILMLATWINDSNYDGEEQETHYYDYEYNYEYNNQQQENDNGGGNNNPIPEDEGEDEYDDKIAVRVIAVDSETNLIIEQAEIEFYLYDGYNSRQTLNTYYPKKTGYQTFETREDGTFFLPEKIVRGEYTLHNISAPVGYVSGGRLTFIAQDEHDWDTPLIVYFPFDRIKSSFSIKVIDDVSGNAVAGGKFELYALQDLILADGTVFAKKGDVIDTLVPDSDGYAESVVIPFRNQFAIRQIIPAEYYAVLSHDIEIPAGTNDLNSNTVIEIPVTMTNVSVNVKDEYNGAAIDGIELSLRNVKTNEYRTYNTDKSGAVMINTLDKDTEYVLTQTVWKDKYRTSTDEYRFSVDSLGRIDENSGAAFEISNRMIRVDLKCLNWFSYASADGYTIRLTDSNGECVAETASSEDMLEGVPVGNYNVEVAGKRNIVLSNNQIEIADTAEIQSFNIRIMTVGGLIILLLIAAVLLSIAVASIVFAVKRIKQKKQIKAK